MQSLSTFMLASLLAGVDLALLALATRRLGKKDGKRLSLWLGAAVALKMILLVAGAVWISRQAWCDRRALLVGLVAPFALFVAWQGLKLQLRYGRRA
jgi:hypothetical protein